MRYAVMMMSLLALAFGAGTRATAQSGAPPAGQASPSGTPSGSETQNLPVVEAILDQELRHRFGVAAQWEIQVTATDEQRAAGHLPKVEIRGTNLQMPDGLVISLVQLTLEGIDVDLQNGVLQPAGTATLHLRVRPDEIARVIERKSNGKLRGVRIDTDEDRFKTRATLRLGFLSLGIRRTSHPEVRGNAIYAHTYRMSVAGLNVGQHMRKMEAKFNPVVDLDELPQPLRLNQLGEDNGDLVLDVSLDLAAPLRSPEEVGKWRERQRKGGRKRR